MSLEREQATDQGWLPGVAGDGPAPGGQPDDQPLGGDDTSHVGQAPTPATDPAPQGPDQGGPTSPEPGVAAPPNAPGPNGNAELPEPSEAGNDNGTGLPFDVPDGAIDMLLGDGGLFAPEPAPELADNAPSGAGELVLTELMITPIGAGAHEWIELHNPGSSALNLRGCEIDGDSLTDHVDVDVEVAPGAYVVLSRDDAELQDGLTANFVYESITMSASDDYMAVVCGGVEIDRVAWGDDFEQRGVSTQLSAGSLDAADNDRAGNWCFGTAPYGNAVNENRGTPGAANSGC